jgi:hypothetical protein
MQGNKEEAMKVNLLLIALLLGAVGWIVDLRRRLESAQMRGDMYRDISARLDKRLAELMAQ